MLLKLNEIEVECVIGDLPEERTKEQKLTVSLELEISDLVGETDNLADTVDYAALTGAVRERLQAAKCRMIERAAYLVCETAFEIGGAALFSVRAAVTKRGSVPHLGAAVAVCERSAR